MQFSIGVRFAKLIGWLEGLKNNAYTLGPKLQPFAPYDETEKSYSPLTKTELPGNVVWKVDNNLLMAIFESECSVSSSSGRTYANLTRLHQRQ